MSNREKPTPPESPLGADLPADELRRGLRRAADRVATYLETVGDYPVLPRVEPGEIAAALPEAPPAEGEPIDRILDDYERLIEPNVTHWNHPGFMAYIAISGSGPGVVGETLAAGLNVNSMLWHSAPAATELEERVCDWLRQMIGLPSDFSGHINDTASIGVFLALAAARERALPNVRHTGLAGRADAARLTVYTSDQAHSSVDKAAIALGIGLDQVRRVASDDAFRLDPRALDDAIAADRSVGAVPLAVLATAGTTSTGSLDPLAAAADVAERHGLWYHVDAAYGGGAAICPEIRRLMEGLERADSIVVNPHKWLFTPIDCSVLFLRQPEVLKEAFSVLPEYLKTPEQGVNNLMDYGLQLGKRFRSLKLWMVIRAFGVEGLRERIRQHLAWARWLADEIDSAPGFELAAPVPLSIVAFRVTLDGASDGEAEDAFNERLMTEINRDGSVLLSHSRLGQPGRYVLRVVIGNIKTTRAHVEAAWELIRTTAERLREEG